MGVVMIVIGIAAGVAAIASIVQLIWTLGPLRRDMTDIRNEFDAAMQQLGAEITLLTDRLAELPNKEEMTQADIDTIRADAARLRSLAASPAVPVPVAETPAPVTNVPGTGGAASESEAENTTEPVPSAPTATETAGDTSETQAPAVPAAGSGDTEESDSATI